MTNPPRLTHRPSYVQRDAYRDVINDAYAEGRLDDVAFAERSSRVDTAHRLRDLEELIGDVPRGDIPIPLKSKQIGRRPDQDKPKPPTVSGKMALTLCAIALVAGVGAGIATADKPESTSSSSHGQSQKSDTNLDVTAVNGFLSYGYLSALLKSLGHERITQLEVRGTAATAYVVNEEGSLASPVEFDKDLKRSNRGGGQELEADQADIRGFAADSLDAKLLYSMVAKAPELVAERGDSVSATSLRTWSLSLKRGQNPQAVGEKENALRVEATVDNRKSSESAGRVTWSGDGEDLLEVLLT